MEQVKKMPLSKFTENTIAIKEILYFYQMLWSSVLVGAFPILLVTECRTITVTYKSYK